MSDIYVSFDIEADGKIPGDSSMINFGAVFYNEEGQEIHAVEYNLAPLPPPAAPDPETTIWWEKQFILNPKLKERLYTNVRQPLDVMLDFSCVCNSMGAFDKTPPSLVAVAYPAGFDFTWLYWYLIHFTGLSPFSFSCLDIKSLAMAKLKCRFHDATKRNFPKSWRNKKAHHTHTGLDDARGQGHLFFSILKEL